MGGGMLDTLTFVAIALTLSFILSEFFFKIKYPRVIGQLITGVILGLPFIKAFVTGDIQADIGFLADLGIIFLLLLTGMKIDIAKFKKSSKDTLILALFSVLFPFAMGFTLLKAFDYPTLAALIFGGAISLTAEGTKLKVLLEMGALNTKLGVIMLGAGILDDVFEIIFLSIVIVLSNHDYSALALLPVKLIIFVIVVLATYKVFPKILRAVQREHSRIATLSFIILFGLVVAVLSNKLDLGPIIGAFVAGVIISLVDRRKVSFKEDVQDLEEVTFAFLIPFFFINIGMHFDVTSLAQNAYFAIIVVVVATLSKIVGAVLATPFTSLNLRQTHLVGWGLNSRGAIELIIAEVALQNNLIPIEIYSALVFMALVTTLMFPFVMKLIIGYDKKILNE
ncbi:MAG: cation:proton antiporter [Candidatus Woesearchaeota archaeon]